MMAGSLLALASCNNAATTAPSQAQIDSMVNSRVDMARIEMEAKNDSIINAMVTMRVDSTLLAMKSGGSSAKTTRPNTTKPTTSTPPKNTGPAPTGKNDKAQENGQPTGKNDKAQETQGQPTGKRR